MIPEFIDAMHRLKFLCREGDEYKVRDSVLNHVAILELRLKKEREAVDELAKISSQQKSKIRRALFELHQENPQTAITILEDA